MGRASLGWPDSAELYAQFRRPVAGQWGHHVPGSHVDGAGGRFDLFGADDHEEPSSCSRAYTAASRAVWTSLSVPDRNTRPKRPTARTSTIVMLAAFSASLAARLAEAAGATSSTNRLEPAISRLPLRHLLISWAWEGLMLVTHWAEASCGRNPSPSAS